MATATSSDWLGPLLDEIATAAGRTDELADVFERLRIDQGADEAGRRWWAAWGATDASPT